MSAPTQLPHISEVVKRLRSDHGMTQKDVATELGVTREAVSYWETGYPRPRREHAHALEDLFGLRRGWLDGNADWSIRHDDEDGGAPVDINGGDGEPSNPDAATNSDRPVDRVNITSTSGSVVPMTPRRRRKIDDRPLSPHAECDETRWLCRNAA